MNQSDLDKIVEDYKRKQEERIRLMMLCIEAENNFRTTVSVKEVKQIMGWD